MLAEITVEQNQETWDLCEGDDDGMDRIKYEVLECPRFSKCSKDAFKRGNVWSYESAEKCRSYLAWHLVKSSKHFLERDEALQEVYCTEVSETIETHADRVQQRADQKDELAKQQAKEMSREREREAQRVNRKPARSRSPRRGGDAKGGGRMSLGVPIGASAACAAAPVHAEVSEMAKAVKDAAKSMQEVANMQQQLMQNSGDGGSSSSTALSKHRAFVIADKVEVPIHHLNVLHQSLKEVRDAMNKLVCLMPVLDASERAIAQLIRN